MSVLPIGFVWYETIPLTKSAVCWITSSTLINPMVHSSIPSSLSADCFSKSLSNLLSLHFFLSLLPHPSEQPPCPSATVADMACWWAVFCSSVPSSTPFSIQWQRFFSLKSQPDISFVLPEWFLSLPTKETLIWLLEFFMLILPQVPLLDFSLSLRILFLSRNHLGSHALTKSFQYGLCITFSCQRYSMLLFNVQSFICIE